MKISIDTEKKQGKLSLREKILIFIASIFIFVAILGVIIYFAMK